MEVTVRIIRTALWISLFAVLAPLGCEKSADMEALEGLTSLRITLESEAGSTESPLEFGDMLAVRLKVEALDHTGSPMPEYKGRVKFQARPGFLGRNGWEEFDVAHGQHVDLSLYSGFGDVRILAEDMDELVVGVAEPIHLEPPTLETAQRPKGDIDTTPWDGSYMRVETGRIVVTHATIDGFYATDIQGTEYNHIYVYTHSTPAVDRGDVLSYVGGSVSEFYGLTEISFPDYKVLCNYYTPPEPVPVTAVMLADRKSMEKLESGLVSVENVTVGGIDEYSYANYGQWVGRAGDKGEITVIIQEALPEFDPYTYKGAIEKIVGNLRQHWSADPEWILVPRDECDVWGVGERPETCDRAMPETTCAFEGG